MFRLQKFSIRKKTSALFTISAHYVNKVEPEIQLRKTLKPAAPTPNHLRSLKLSLFDQVAPPTYSALLWNYLPNSECDKAKNDERCGKLQKSLAETLAKFYPLAGRYRKDHFSIECNDDGVEYVETKVNADLAEFLHQGKENELLDDLLPWHVPPKVDLFSSPLLGIQVNKFNCGGLVVGLQASHVLVDAFTLGAFVNEWAHINKTGMIKGSPPSFGHLSSLFPARTLSGPQFSLSSCSPGANIVTRRFVFDALAITELKDKIDSSSATMVKSTRVEAVMSLIWKILTGISSAKHGQSRDSTLIFAMNLRGKTKIPSSEHVLGNFLIGAIATLEANQSRKELSDFANVVRRTSRDTISYIGKASIEDITSGFANGFPLGEKDDMDFYVCSSLCRFPWYEADFGWGKPSSVSTTNKSFELINLIDMKNGDGIEAWVNLTENDMAEFEKDPDILTYCQAQK